MLNQLHLLIYRFDPNYLDRRLPFSEQYFQLKISAQICAVTLTVFNLHLYKIFFVE